MSKEEETPARVTRGALRRMSVDQEPASTPGTPKKATTSTKKSAGLDAIQEGSTGPSDVEEDSATRSAVKGKKDASFVENKSLQKVKEFEVKSTLRSRAASLTEDNIGVMETIETRRTPRRRPSQDTTLTPQTAPAATRRKTRKNSTTSDDGTMPATTPKASKSRLSVAPPTIAEDDEKESKANNSSTAIAEAELSDLDIRKLRNRAISNSPVPRCSPSGKNSSMASHKGDEGEADSSKVSSPSKDDQDGKDVMYISDASVEPTPPKNEDSKSVAKTPIGSVKRQLKDVTFEEGTPKQLDRSVFPKTPGEKPRKLSEKYSSDAAQSPSVATPEVLDETVHESPQRSAKKATTPKRGSPTKSAVGTPKKADKSLDNSIDMSLANIVEDVRENINQVDHSMSILGTPKPTGKQKSRFSHLREGTFSTPISKLPEGDEEKATSDSTTSASWGQAVKGSGNDKGIDVFSVRKQEQEKHQEEQTKQLNESLKRKSLETKMEVDDEEEDVEEEEEDDDEPKANSFVDDEAIEVKGYESGDSMDSETRAEMKLNELEIDCGESLGSKDSEIDDEEDEYDSFIATDDDLELLDGSGDDLGSEPEENRSKVKKNRKRIMQPADSSDDEEQSVIEVDESVASESKSPKNTPKKVDMDKSKSPKKTPAKNTPQLISTSKSPKKTPAKNSPKLAKKTPAKTPSVDDENEEQSTEIFNADESKSPQKSPAKTPAKTPAKNSSDEDQIPNEIQEDSETPQSQKKKSAESRKSLPAAALISADFYSSAKKSGRRNTMIVLDCSKPTEQLTETDEEPVKPTNLVSNPAALALAKKNKRLSLGASPAEAAPKKDKRASLPGKLPVDKHVESPLKKKQKEVIPEENGAEYDEPMEVDEYEEEEEVPQASPVKKPAAVKKVRDLSDFDTSAILARCNEIVRSDKEKRKEGATLKQKKKDEKRRQREEEQKEDGAEANDSTEQQKKKKKKKKKPVNYLLEELGETKEDQVARALKRKMAILEAKRERKKAKKAAKLQQQLNKENRQEEGEKKEGIGAKFEKKAKKDKKAKKGQKATVEEKPVVPVVKRAISAVAVYAAQIEELKKEQLHKKRKEPRSKQLKEKNHQPSAAEEVMVALQETKSKKEKKQANKLLSVALPASDESHQEIKKKSAADKEVDAEKPAKQVPQKKKGKTPLNEPEPTSAPSVPAAEDKPAKKKHEQSDPSEKQQKPERMFSLLAPLKSVGSMTDAELAILKKSLTDPVTRVVKKQKISEHGSKTVTVSPSESTPPRKFKAVTRLEHGFYEEPVTPDHKLLKRNHGFREEPVTPKTTGFKVSAVLPAGQEALQQQATLAKKRKIYSKSNRIRSEDVKEPVKGLPQPIWTKSGSFEVVELSEAAKSSKKSKPARALDGDIIPLSVNGAGQCSTAFLVKPLGSKKAQHSSADGSTRKAHRVDLATVHDSVLNFKQQAIFGDTAHLREKKRKH